MAKINQIQNALKELGGGAFQNLADSYLLKKGYPQIISLGSVAGSNKVRKGTPDTLVPTNDGKYVFAEYTTISERQVFNKFKEDIAKCLNEEKTGVPITKSKSYEIALKPNIFRFTLEFLHCSCNFSLFFTDNSDVQHSTISLILVIGTPVFSSLRHFAIS
jgi:hypothetical protein